MSQFQRPFPPPGPSRPPEPLTVAEAKARLLALGEEQSRQVQALVDRTVAEVKAEVGKFREGIRKTTPWFAGAAAGLGLLIAGLRGRRKEPARAERWGRRERPETPAPLKLGAVWAAAKFAIPLVRGVVKRRRKRHHDRDHPNSR